MSLNNESFYRFDDFELQPSRRLLLRAGQRVSIAPKTFDVLLCLVAKSGRVVLKDEILSTVWPDSFVEEGNLTQHIFWLRKALADRAPYIVTIPGRGYEFTGVTTLVPAEPPPTATPEPLPAAAQPSPAPQVHISHGVELTRMVVEETTFPAAAHRRPWLPIAGAALVIAVVAGVTTWKVRHRSQSPAAAVAPSSVSTAKAENPAPSTIPSAPAAAPTSAVPTDSTVPVPSDIPHAAGSSDHHQVVLADFDNSTGDTGFDRALKTLLAADLGQSPFLVVTSEADTSRALKLMNRPPDDALTPALAREVCERLNDQVVVSGLIARFGGKYLLTGTATDCESGRQLAQSKAVAENRETVLSAVDTLAGDLRSRLGEPLKSLHPSGQPLEYQHTTSLEALKLYSEGRALARTGMSEKALPILRRAVELDPNFAAAWLEIAVQEDVLREFTPSSDAITHAYAVRDQTDEPTRLAITAFYIRKTKADYYALMRIYLDWTERYPQQAEAWANLSGVQRELARTAEAIRSGRRAVALAPDMSSAYDALMKAQLQAGELDDALATARESARHNADGIGIHYHMLEIADFRDDEPAIAKELAWGKASDGGESPMAWLQAYYALSHGQIRKAHATFDHAMELYHEKGFDVSTVGFTRSWPCYLAEMGMTDQAKDLLDSGKIKGSSFDLVLARVLLGDPAAAKPMLDSFADKYIDSTPIQSTMRPILRAVQALALHKPDDAIAILTAAMPFEPVTPRLRYYRGLAYLDAGKPALAQDDFSAIITRPASFAVFVPLAHLGLLRAYKAQRTIVPAVMEYNILRKNFWKDADPDFPLLKQAQAVMASTN